MEILEIKYKKPQRKARRGDFSYWSSSEVDRLNEIWNEIINAKWEISDGNSHDKTLYHKSDE